MSFIHAIQSMLPRPENRSRDQIARDLDDEFDFHLEMKARALQSEEGLEREAARGLAHKQFGDIDRIRKDCQRIALRERIMLQRVNLVLMIVVMLVVIAVGAQVYLTQRYNTLALQAITADLARMKFDAMAATRPASGPGLVYLDGDVPRPGVYSIPSAGILTLSRLITAAGAPDNHNGTFAVTVYGTDPEGKSVVRYINAGYSLDRDVKNDYVPTANDRIMVALTNPGDARKPNNSGDRRDDARAAAVGDFVVRLFALADPNDPNLDQTIRNFLDAEEKAADQRYADDPATAGMIKELIAARRKIFEADANALRAATAEQKAEAVSNFLQDMLASADTTAPAIKVSDVLDHASKHIDEQFADNPELAAQMRERIAEAQKNLQAPDAGAADPPGVDHSLDISPFQAVRWKDQWTPIVNYAGQWYELRSIHGADVSGIRQHCMQRHGEERVRQRFSEDLLAMLLEMGFARPDNDRITMQIVDLRSGSLIAVNEAEMTADNRTKILAANAAAIAAGKPFPEFVEPSP